MDLAFEERTRLAAFEELRSRQAVYGEVLPTEVLKRPLHIDGRDIPIFQQARGIHKPAALTAALSLLTAAPKDGKKAPYEDQWDSWGALRYQYRDPKTDTDRARAEAEADNAAVRTALRHNLPLIYFVGVVPGHYLPLFPTYVVADHSTSREFSLDPSGLGGTANLELSAESIEHGYRSTVVKRRIHQAEFRQRILRAYQSHCAVCRLHRAELVEAAHIIPDSEGGAPEVTNGLALCKLHHTAYDRGILGIRPDYVVQIRHDILAEVDGPMLQHGIKEFHDHTLLWVPRRQTDRPSTAHLEQRFEKFKAA